MMSSDHVPKQAIDWIVSNLGSHVRVVEIQKLQGSTSSDLFRIHIQENTKSRILVLRLLTNPAWLADEPTWQNMRLLRWNSPRKQD